MAAPARREQVFFSYSRKDKKWLELFQTSLKPLVRANQMTVWDDTKIQAGDVWRDEIKQALASAKVAVLLVSRNFLASDFIAENELPPLLEAAQKDGLKILMVIVGHSLFAETEIGRYQAVNDPARPLAGMSAANREKEVVRICLEIKAAASLEAAKKDSAPGAPVERTLLRGDKAFTVSRARLLPGKKDLVMFVDAFATLHDLLNTIFFALDDAVEPFTYGTSWVLRDKASGKTFKHARMIVGAGPGNFVGDNRTLGEVGIKAGMALEVVPLGK